MKKYNFINSTQQKLKMINEINFINYILLFLPFLACYGFGKLFYAGHFFTTTIIGASFTATVLAILANLNAGLISPTLYTLLTASSVLTIISLFKNFPQFKKDYNAIYLLNVLIIIFLLFYLNDISEHFFSKNGNTFNFNDHYSYYAIQPIEMLNANYSSRLRVMNLYPLEWTRYHFHTTSIYAIFMCLQKIPNLLHYLMSQVLFYILILLAIYENLALTRPFSVVKSTILFLVLAFGLSIFHHTIGWHLSTSGALSILALFLLIKEVTSKPDRKRIIIYVCLFSVSAFRLVPIGLILLGSIIIHSYLKNWLPVKKTRLIQIKSLIKLLRSFAYFEYGAIMILCLYIIATLIGSKQAPLGISFFSNEIYSHNWSYGIYSHQILKHIFDSLGLTNFFHDPEKLNLFSSLSNYKVLNYTFIISIIILVPYQALNSFKEIKNRTFILTHLFFYLLIALIGILSSPSFALIILLNFTVLNYLLRILTPSSESYFFIYFLYFLSILFQFTGANGIKSPVISLIFDPIHWFLLAIIFSRSFSIKKTAPLIFIMLSIFIISKKRLSGFLVEPTMYTVDISNISRKNLEKNKSISKDNILKINRSPKDLQLLGPLTGSRTLNNIQTRSVFRTVTFASEEEQPEEQP